MPLRDGYQPICKFAYHYKSQKSNFKKSKVEELKKVAPEYVKCSKFPLFYTKIIYNP